MKKKNFWMVLLALLLALALVACGGDDSATVEDTGESADSGEAAEPSEPAEEPEETAEEKSEAPAEADGALGAAELVYWSMWNETEPQAQVIQGWIDEF